MTLIGSCFLKTVHSCPRYTFAHDIVLSYKVRTGVGCCGTVRGSCSSNPHMVSTSPCREYRCLLVYPVCGLRLFSSIIQSLDCRVSSGSCLVDPVLIRRPSLRVVGTSRLLSSNLFDIVCVRKNAGKDNSVHSR